MTETTNLQGVILTECCNNRIPVTLYLMNGFQLRGEISGFDSSVIILATEGKRQMIYKHAISTLVPMKSVKACAL